MNKKEISEIKRRLKKESTTITRLAGCYVNANKEKVLTFNKNFLNLPDEDFFKYLEIAKKTLSGNLGNQLLTLEFPAEEEKAGGKQSGLMAVKSSALKNEGILDAFYDLVIETYEHVSNYLILLFHDCYDIPMKATDETKIGESDEVFEYILCAICPVDLSKPALGYKEAEKEIGARERDWVVGAPESGFLFPAFTDRTTDIHSILVYTKNTKEPHKELWENILGCKTDVLTSDEKKEAFYHIVKRNTASETQEDGKQTEVQTSVIAMLENAEAQSEVVLSQDEVTELFTSAGIEEAKAKKMADECLQTLGEQMPHAGELISKSEAKKAEEIAEKKRLVKENEELKSMLPKDIMLSDEKIIVSVAKEKETEIRFSEENGMRYLMIPVESDTTVLVNGEEKEN